MQSLDATLSTSPARSAVRAPTSPSGERGSSSRNMLSSAMQAASHTNSSTMAPGASTAVASATTTLTITEAPADTSEPEVLTLSLRARPSVTWDENVVDNEGMCRKSSKRCCIFHKQREFGESSTDSSDDESDRSGDGDDNGGDGKSARRKGKIARPKKDKVPDYQRFHA